MRSYQADLSDCEAYAQQVNMAEKAVVHGATGAVVAVTVGAIFDGSEGARAVLGTVKGGSRGLSERDRVLRRCLRGRRYKVLSQGL